MRFIQMVRFESCNYITFKLFYLNKNYRKCAVEFQLFRLDLFCIVTKTKLEIMKCLFCLYFN